MHLSRIRTSILLLTIGLLVGCGDSENFVLTTTSNRSGQTAANNPIDPIQPPVASNDNFSALGNATLNQAAPGVLTNDTLNDATVSDFDLVGSRGGALTLHDDGSFAYTPLTGFVGAETFAYTLTNSGGDSTATVTLTSRGFGRFVDNSVADGGTGTQAHPFDTLAEATAIAEAGDTILVLQGDGSSTGLSDDVTLPEGVDLIGQGQGLILAQTIVPKKQAPIIAATVTILGDNTISGLVFDDEDQGILGNAVANVTITNNIFRDGESEVQIELKDMTGNITIATNTFLLENDADATEMDTSESGTCTLVLNNNTFGLTTPTAEAGDCFQVEVDGTTATTIQMNNNEFNGSSDTLTSLGRGLRLEPDEDSQVTLTASGNTAIFMDRPWLSLEADDRSAVMATISQNVWDQSRAESLADIELETDDDATATVVLENNSLTNSQDRGIDVEVDDLSTFKLALRNNTITGTNDDAADFIAGEDSNFCAEITGNTFGADLTFNDQTRRKFEVEQFGDVTGTLLKSLNNFTAGGVQIDNGSITSVPEGACAIP